MRVEWTGGPKTGNGGYGLYPVLCKNVLIENSIAIGASDSGIYVGQSRDVIVRNSRAERNVAGIEIENTINADVYDNVATGNTGGILVFNMPALTQQGDAIRVFKNKVVENNLDNFGAKGTPVASVPAGSGVVINSNAVSYTHLDVYKRQDIGRLAGICEILRLHPQAIEPRGRDNPQLLGPAQQGGNNTAADVSLGRGGRGKLKRKCGHGGSLSVSPLILGRISPSRASFR